MLQNDTAIHIDFEINRHDLFRVALELAKWRLFAGLIVAAVPIVGLSCFFLYIVFYARN